MGRPDQVITRERWQDAYERIRSLPPHRQEEIADYIDFVLERQEEEEWDLSPEEEAGIARHLTGDLADTVPLSAVRDKLLRGDADDL